MPLTAIHIATALLDFLAAGPFLAFVWRRRLGKVWLLVFIALLIKGFVSIGMTVEEPNAALSPLPDCQVPVAELFVSLLMACGFVLTGQWFRVKERLEVKDFVASTIGDYTTSTLNCAVINRRQFDRLQRYVDDAKARNCANVIELGSAADGSGPCRMPLTLVIDPEAGSLLDQNEVFGPILPIVTYTDFDQVVTRIQAGERPLGIYIFSDQPALIERLQRNTSSGGFCVNAASLQGAQENLGFGGVGKSGMGRHHGLEGFREFSNPRGCVELASDANVAPLMSPHDEAARQFIRAVTGGMLGG